MFPSKHHIALRFYDGMLSEWKLDKDIKAGDGTEVADHLRKQLKYAWPD
jgi:hypothetical protein